MMKKITLLVLSLFILQTVTAEDRFVKGTGSDTNDGKTEKTAFRSLQYAADKAQPGDIVWIGSGIYTALHIQTSGTPDAWITWKAIKGQQPEIRPTGWTGILISGSYHIIDGLIVTGRNDSISLLQAIDDGKKETADPAYNTNGIYVNGRLRNPGEKPHHVVIRNCTVGKCPGGGITAIETDYITIEDCKVFENAWYMRYAGSGITTLNNWAYDDAPGYHFVIQRNLVWNNKCLVPWIVTGKLSDGNGILLDVTDQNETQAATNPNADAIVTASNPATDEKTLKSRRPEWKGRSLIANNISAYNGGSGIHTFRTKYVDIINNTTYWNGQVVGYQELFPNRSEDIVILNNIIVPRPAGKVTSDNKNVNIRWDYNLYPVAQEVFRGTHDIVANPLFVNIRPDLREADFQLLKNSPGRASGAHGQSVDKQEIETQLLQKAQENIEKHRKGDVSITITDKNGKTQKDARIEVNQLTQDFLFGNLSEEIFNKGLSSEDFQKFEKAFTDLFNFTELTIKWTPFENKQGNTQWEFLQKKLNWCKKNNITPKGHALGWTNMSGTPPWLLKLPLQMSFDLYKARIYNLVGGLKDQMSMWDVVNEPITTVPWEIALKDSVFGESLIDAGNRYDTKNITVEEVIPWVEKSLRWSYEANPAGDFMLNEFYVIAKPEIREKFYQLIKGLQTRNVPLNGIGIQAHEPREMWFSPLETVKTFDKYAELGLPIHITEFIPQSSGKEITGGWRNGVWTEETQAEFAEQFYTLAFGHPSVTSIHWWGLADRFIWLQGGGLLDKDLNPKPVYTRLKKLIREEWMTRNLSLKTDHKGKAAFRGFYGQYEIILYQKDGTTIRLEKQLQKDNDNNWQIIL